MRTILVHGASTAAGWYDMERFGWANRLNADALHANLEHPEEAVCIQNRSIPGGTILGLLKDMDHVGRHRKMGSVISILALGLNETKIRKGQDTPLVSPDRFKEALNMYTAANRSFDARELFLGIELLLQDTIVTENGNTFKDSLVAEYDQLIKEHAERVGAPYISARNILSSIGPDKVIANDGYHPNALGHAAIYSAVVNVLEGFDIFKMKTDNSSPGDITNLLT